MATAAQTRCTPEEYLALERKAEFKSEYIDGRIIAMPPGESRPHNLIVTALCGALGKRLPEDPCEVYLVNMRVKVAASGDYVYPDVVVSCDPEFEDDAFDSLLTPILVIEVLSEATEAHDRGKKLSLYRRIEALREYVLISQKEPLVECHVRTGDDWRSSVIHGLDASFALTLLGVEVPLEDIYSQALLPTRRVFADHDNVE